MDSSIYSLKLYDPLCTDLPLPTVLKRHAQHNFWSDSHFYCTCHMWNSTHLFKCCSMHSFAAPVAAVCTSLWESVCCIFPFGIHLSGNNFLRRGMDISALMQLVIIFTYHSSQHVKPGSLLSHPSTQLTHIGSLCIPYITWNSNRTLPRFSEGFYSEFSRVLDLKWSAKLGSRLWQHADYSSLSHTSGALIEWWLEGENSSHCLLVPHMGCLRTKPETLQWDASI